MMPCLKSPVRLYSSFLPCGNFFGEVEERKECGQKEGEMINDKGERRKEKKEKGERRKVKGER